MVKGNPLYKEVPAETWRLLDKALRENRIITFDYQSLTDTEPHPRRVQPWQLIFDNGKSRTRR